MPTSECQAGGYRDHNRMFPSGQQPGFAAAPAQTGLLSKPSIIGSSFESEGIPYVDDTGPEPKLAAVKLVERPLPTDPPETPEFG